MAPGVGQKGFRGRDRFRHAFLGDMQGKVRKVRDIGFDARGCGTVDAFDAITPG